MQATFYGRRTRLVTRTVCETVEAGSIPVAYPIVDMFVSL
jgi:hypothetical protein